MASATVTQALRDALNELEAERDRIEAAIANLRRVLVDMGGGARRGRPPGTVAAKRMKAYWATKKQAA